MEKIVDDGIRNWLEAVEEEEAGNETNPDTAINHPQNEGEQPC